ncbi:zinc c2h2 type family protein [Stylonychia lemnae]|uniref:Zinc c2h2 type family protein n=1 Tax=Stylonychia lemnae TaxID=5949 RepID=A0A078B8S6_STYLE|nr:zinc c2h2 type family protein [Stylonychia lemnae]|eukprot:CDW90819.1 zinc c2h2 type family protein [Stylonychia lemnae]
MLTVQIMIIMKTNLTIKNLNQITMKRYWENELLGPRAQKVMKNDKEIFQQGDQDDRSHNHEHLEDQKQPVQEKPKSNAPLEIHCLDANTDEDDNLEGDFVAQNFHYYKEYCQLYYANTILTTRLQQLLNEKQELQFKLNRLESNKRKHEEALGMTFDIAEEKRKRHRRTATEIARHYRCPIEDCPKSYGSEGSLNQHIKLKHPEFYQQMSAANPSLPGINDSKRGGDSTVNDGHSHHGHDDGDTYGDRSDDSDQSDDVHDDESYSQRQGGGPNGGYNNRGHQIGAR